MASFIADASKPLLSIDIAAHVAAHPQKTPLVPSQTNLVVYHGQECPDGFAAAFSAWKLLGDAATYVPAEHGPAAPRLDVTGKHVVVCDYCFSKEETERMIRDAASFIVLDHHATAVDVLASVPDAYKVFSMKQSGATLAWNYFHGVEVPTLLRYVEDKDIWRWAMRDSQAFTAGFSAPQDFAAWDALLAGGDAAIERIINDGRSVLQYRKKVIESHVKRAVPCRLAAAPTLKGMIVNASTLASEIGNALALMDGVDYGLMWTFDHESSAYRVSLRSARDDVDVAALAGLFGGGGHKRASGFSYQGKAITDLLTPPTA